MSEVQMDQETGVRPDPTALLVAAWRAMHLLLDPPPHVFHDDLGLRMADCPVGRSTLGVPSASPLDQTPWTDFPLLGGPLAAPFRPLMVGRARCNEDLLARLVDNEGLDQYVILGAGLSRQLRPPPGGPAQPFDGLRNRPARPAGLEARTAGGTEPVGPARPAVRPGRLRERQTWASHLAEAGFDRHRPAFLSAIGLTQYIDEAATQAIFEEAAALAPGTAVFCGFIVPEDLVDQAERESTARIREEVASRGCPLISEYLRTSPLWPSGRASTRCATSPRPNSRPGTSPDGPTGCGCRAWSTSSSPGGLTPDDQSGVVFAVIGAARCVIRLRCRIRSCPAPATCRRSA